MADANSGRLTNIKVGGLVRLKPEYAHSSAIIKDQLCVVVCLTGRCIQVRPYPDGVWRGPQSGNAYATLHRSINQFMRAKLSTAEFVSYTLLKEKLHEI